MNKNTDELFLERIRTVFQKHNTQWIEKRMFGGLCFMVDDKMCLGSYRGGMMARVDPEEIEELLQREGAEQMIHGGRTMTGFAFIQPEGFEDDDDLEFWVVKCIEFNPKAKSSKKKKKKKKK